MYDEWCVVFPRGSQNVGMSMEKATWIQSSVFIVKSGTESHRSSGAPRAGLYTAMCGVLQVTYVKNNFESVLRHLQHVGIGLTIGGSRITSMPEVLSLGLLWKHSRVLLLNFWRHS